MNDYEAIQETVYHYFEGYVSKDRARLEKAFATDIANMMGYWKLEDGTMELFSTPITELIDKWVSPDFEPFEFTERRILSLHIFAENAATVVFDCGGKFLDTFQLVKTEGDWKIVNKFFVDQ